MQARGYESQPRGLSCADGLTSTSAGTCGCRKFGRLADLRFWVMPLTDWVLVQARWRCASCNASVAHEVSVATGETVRSGDTGRLGSRISATPGSADHETSRSQRRTEFRAPTGPDRIVGHDREHNRHHDDTRFTTAATPPDARSPDRHTAPSHATRQCRQIDKARVSQNTRPRPSRPGHHGTPGRGRSACCAVLAAAGFVASAQPPGDGRSS